MYLKSSVTFVVSPFILRNVSELRLCLGYTQVHILPALTATPPSVIVSLYKYNMSSSLYWLSALSSLTGPMFGTWSDNRMSRKEIATTSPSRSAAWWDTRDIRKYQRTTVLELSIHNLKYVHNYLRVRYSLSSQTYFDFTQIISMCKIDLLLYISQYLYLYKCVRNVCSIEISWCMRWVELTSTEKTLYLIIGTTPIIITLKRQSINA